MMDDMGVSRLFVFFILDIREETHDFKPMFF